VLGKLLPDRFAGGRLTLDVDAATRAIDERVASPLGLDVDAAARAIHDVVVENMAAAARAHAAEWGKTAAGRTLVAYGGAGPLHACALADLLKIDKVIVPSGAGVGSALGFLAAPVSFEVVRSRYLLARTLDAGEVRELFADMSTEARAVVERATDAPLEERRRAYMRYAGQGYELTVAVPDPADPRLGDALVAAFEDEYRTLYGRTIPGPEIEILSFMLALTTVPAPLVRIAAPVGLRDARPVGEARATLGGERTVAVYARERLLVGDRVAGPALVVEAQTTTAVLSGFAAIVNGRGDLVLAREVVGV
jgi:N-methylhydantoinase A